MKYTEILNELKERGLQKSSPSPLLLIGTKGRKIMVLLYCLMAFQ